jgi:hypothetical protein
LKPLVDFQSAPCDILRHANTAETNSWRGYNDRVLLINACHKGVKGLNRINRLASKADLNDKQQLEEIQAQNDATYEVILADIEFARKTRAKSNCRLRGFVEIGSDIGQFGFSGRCRT